MLQIGQSPCKAVPPASSKTPNSRKKSVRNNLVTTEFTYLDTFVTNIVLHQLRMIFKKFIQLTLIYLGFSSVEMSAARCGWCKNP